MVKKNFVKEKLKSDRPVMGIWSIIPSSTTIEIIGNAGFDFQILDMEHGAFDFVSLEAGIRASESVGCSPLVRPPGVDVGVVQKALDFGAHGIVVPQVKDYNSALSAVQTTQYSPAGTRGFNPFTRAGLYSGGTAPALNDEFSLTSMIIETEQAYRELDRILSIPGLDMLYLGVYDMSLALGCKGNFTDAKIVSFLEDSIPRIRRSGKAAGVMVKDKAEMEYFTKLGANMLVYMVDAFVFSKAIADANETFSGLEKKL